jgi:hypothetical protein
MMQDDDGTAEAAGERGGEASAARVHARPLATGPGR